MNAAGSSRSIKILLALAAQKENLEIEKLLLDIDLNCCEIESKDNFADVLEYLRANECDLCVVEPRLARDDKESATLAAALDSHDCAAVILLLESEAEAFEPRIAEFGAARFFVKNKFDRAQFARIARRAIDSARKQRASGEHEFKFRNFIESLPVMFYAVEGAPPYAPIYVSPEFARFGYPLDEWQSNVDMWIKTLHPDDRDRVLRETEAAMRTGRETDLKYRVVALDKRVHWVHDYGRFVKTDAGEIVCWQGVMLDITAHKRADEDLRRSEQRYREMFEKNRAIKLLIDPETGAIVKANPAACDFYGYALDEFKTKLITDLNVLPASEVRREIARARSEKRSYFEFRHRLASGEARDVEVHSSPLDNNGKPLLYSIVCDVTERKQAENALVESERSYRFLSEGIMHQVWTALPDGKLNYVNRRALDYFGCTIADALGDNWQAMVHREDLPGCLNCWHHSLETGADYHVEFRLRRADGEFRWHDARATAARDQNGRIVNWYGTSTDINDKKIAEAKLSHLARHDALTALPNRAAFMDYLARAVARASLDRDSRFAVLFLDLDRFKIINDGLGHIVGDKLLVAIAERLQTCVRPGDIAARLGGDEFTILLGDIADADEAARVAERVQRALAKPFLLDNYEVFTSASIGVIVSDEIARQPEDFLRDADTAMYRAKERGKARYEIFDREMRACNSTLLQIENDLRRAVEREEFTVFYQPIISLDTNEICEFEALVRWRHAEFGLIAPGEFIHVAEETGLIVQIGEWILREACRQTAEWQQRAAARQIAVSVNLSAKQLLNPALPEQVKTVLRETALDARFLKLEVTESMVMEQSDRALGVLNELRRLGVSLSTDDFGTGYSSLSYLHRFPFERLKIDRSFVNKMDSDQKSREIVRTILLLAKTLNLETVAEGIENERQLGLLRALGCKLGQGFLFSKPVAAAEAAKFLGGKTENRATQSGCPIFEASFVQQSPF